MRVGGGVWIAAMAVAAGACAGTADDDLTTTTPTASDTTSAVTSTRPTSPAGGRADCVGFYQGSFAGAESGPLALSITDDGSLATVFVRPDTLDVDFSDLGSVETVVEEIGLVFGEDITIGLSGVEISPSALGLDASGVRLGILAIDLDPDGSVDEVGGISGSERLTGNFEWSNCTGSGEWTDGDASGTWSAVLGAAGLTVDVEACDEGIFVGVESDFGDIDIDFDAFCLSRSVRDLPVRSETEDVQVKGDDETSVYTLSATVLFEFGSAALTAAATETLDEVAAAITAEGVVDPKITVIGHTDSIGSEEFNLDLSTRRAAAVQSALEDRLPNATIEAFGLGETSPIAANGNPDGTDNPEGRRRNRRVEIIVTG